MEKNNCLIQVHGPEVPILDSSALPLYNNIESMEHDAKRKYLNIDNSYSDLKLLVNVDFTF